MLLIWPGQLLDDPCNSDIRLGQKTMLPKVSLLVSSKFKGAMSGYLLSFTAGFKIKTQLLAFLKARLFSAVNNESLFFTFRDLRV